MSLNNESSYGDDDSSSDDDQSFQSNSSMICSSSLPAWSRSSSMTSGISAISDVSSAESKEQFKAKFGPISRPSTTELKTYDSWIDSQVQQISSKNSSPNQVQMKSKRKSFVPVQPKIIRPAVNIPQPLGWFMYSTPMYRPPMQHYQPPIMYYPSPIPPPVQMPMNYTMSMVCSMPFPTPAVPSLYNQPQARYVSVQTQCTYTYNWTYIDYV